MTSKAALAMALLEGRILNVKNVFQTIGLTNCSREISRMIEKPFGIIVSRTPRKGKNKYGMDVSWIDYRLNRSEHNINGIIKMERYIEEHSSTNEKQKSELQTNKLF